MAISVLGGWYVGRTCGSSDKVLNVSESGSNVLNYSCFGDINVLTTSWRIDIIEVGLANTTGTYAELIYSLNKYSIASTGIQGSGHHYNLPCQSTLSQSRYLSLIDGHDGQWEIRVTELLGTVNTGVIGYMTLNDTVRDVPPIPSISKTTSCVSNTLTNRISLESPDWTDTTSYKVQRKTAGGSYSTINTITNGDAEYYDDTSGENYYYRVSAENGFWTNIRYSNVVYSDFTPEIEAAVVWDDYPTLTFTAKTTNFCDNITDVKWYIDGVLDGTSTGATYSSTLDNSSDVFTLTAKYTIDGNLTTESNEVDLYFFQTGTTLSGFTSNGTMVIPSTYTKCDYLIVAGGGGGGGTTASAGFACGAGGGAGGYLSGTINNVTYGNYTVTVGSGGAGGGGGATGSNGTNSSFSGMTAIGGGGGGGATSTPLGRNGGNGGSGGGGGASLNGGTSTGTKGTATSGQGYVGWNGQIQAGYAVVGGMGGGGAGTPSSYFERKGISNNISGAATTYSEAGKGADAVYTSPGSTTNGAAAVNLGGGGDAAKSISSGSATGGAGGDGIVYVYLYNEYPDVPNAPTGVTANTITTTGATLSWVNNTTVATGITIQQLSGGTWVDIDVLASGTTSYSLTGLIPNTSYQYRVVAKNELFSTNSASYLFTTLDPTPFNLSANVLNGGATVNWEINDPPFGTGIRPEIRLSGATSGYTSGDTISHSAVTHTFTGLTYSTSYDARFVRLGSEYPSEPIYFTTPDFSPPAGLSATTVAATYVKLLWANNDDYDTLTVYYSSADDSGSLSVNASATTATITGLDVNTEYTFYVRSTKGSYAGNSDSITETTRTLEGICNTDPWVSVFNATCGTQDGYMELVNPEYTQIYTIYARDAAGNFFPFDEDPDSATFGHSTSMTAGWYGLQATVKTEYVSQYGSGTCYKFPVAVENTGSTISLSSINVKPTLCNSFGSDQGRIDYYVTDTVTGSTYYVKIYAIKEDGSDFEEVYSDTSASSVNPISFIPDRNNNYDCFYAFIGNNSNGCVLLVGQTCLEQIEGYAVEGINKLYITDWDNNVFPNYWNTTEENFYNPSIDSGYYTSLKIKNLNDLPSEWKRIPLDGVTAEIKQVMNKSNVGFTFTDTLELDFNNYDNSKWVDLQDILDKRKIIVYRTNTGYWYVMGVRHGAEVNSFENGTTLQLDFSAISRDKILPEIDYTYVHNNLLTATGVTLTNCDYYVDGIRKAWICGYTTGGTKIDFPLEYTVETGTTFSTIETTWDEKNSKVTIAGQDLEYRELDNFGEGSILFKETYEKTNAGKEYVKEFEVAIPHVNLYATTAIKEYAFSITQEFELAESVLFIESYNEDLWVVGYDNPMVMNVFETQISGQNQYVLKWTSRSPRRIRNFKRM